MTGRIAVAAAIVALLAIVAFATGWANDKAPPGSRGRAPVTSR